MYILEEQFIIEWKVAVVDMKATYVCSVCIYIISSTQMYEMYIIVLIVCLQKTIPSVYEWWNAHWILSTLSSSQLLNNYPTYFEF